MISENNFCIITVANTLASLFVTKPTHILQSLYTNNQAITRHASFFSKNPCSKL